MTEELDDYMFHLPALIYEQMSYQRGQQAIDNDLQSMLL